MSLPNIDIQFKQRAASAVERSTGGRVCIVLKDETKGVAVASFKTQFEVPQNAYTQINITAINAAFLGEPSEVSVVRLSLDETFADVKKLLDNVEYNWLCALGAEMQEEVVAYIKDKNTRGKNQRYKAVVQTETAPDDMHIVNIANESAVTKSGEEVSVAQYLLPRICGLLAGLPMTRACTYIVLSDLKSVAEVADAETLAGKLVLINDDGPVRVGRGVNSLTTTDSTHTADMKKITIVEAMDAILADISSEFKNNYIGKYKNNYDNQSLFISAINGYFKWLAADDVLEHTFENTSSVDVQAQRAAWISAGTDEAVGWDDAKVKKMSFGSQVFLVATLKILDSIEDIQFAINMA